MKFAKEQKARYVGMVSFALCFILVYWLMTGPLSSEKPVEEQLQALSSGLSEKCPVMVDDITRLDSVRSEGLVLNYFYTLVDADKDMGDFAGVRPQIEAQILEQVKTNPDMKALRESRVTFGYIYYDRNGKRLFEFKITPGQYT